MIVIAKDQEIKFRISKENAEKIKQNAEKSKMTLTDYLTYKGMDESNIIILEDLHPVCHELRKIGGNLNQIAMLANQGRITCVNLTQMYEAVDRLWQPLNLLTEKIRRIKR